HREAASTVGPAFQTPARLALRHGGPAAGIGAVRRTLTFAVILVALYVAQTAPVRADACIADQFGGLVCGEGKGALRVSPTAPCHRRGTRSFGAARRACPPVSIFH